MDDIIHNECYYCDKRVHKNDFGWRASKINKSGQWERWPCHHNCMKKEKAEIIKTDNWERGKQYEFTHTLVNPLAQSLFIAKCGCKVSLYKKDKSEKYQFSILEHICYKHKLFRWIAIPHQFKLKPHPLYYIDKYLFSISRKLLHKHYGSLFLEAYKTGIINDPYHEKIFKISKSNVTLLERGRA